MGGLRDGLGFVAYCCLVEIIIEAVDAVTEERETAWCVCISSIRSKELLIHSTLSQHEMLMSFRSLSNGKPRMVRVLVCQFRRFGW
jgi:hypothetical protein